MARHRGESEPEPNPPLPEDPNLFDFGSEPQSAAATPPASAQGTPRRTRQDASDPGESAQTKHPVEIGRRLLIASTVVASIAASRITSIISEPHLGFGDGPPVPNTVTGAANIPVARPTGLPTTATPITYVSPYDFGLVDGAADNTKPMQDMFDALITSPGARALLPGGVINVTNLRIDYANIEAQPSSGAPYGYPGPKIEGSSKRGTIIKQIEGTEGDVLTIQGKINQAAGPANNNKISGLSLSNLEIQGATSGGNGLYLRSIVDSAFEEITITNCDSGLYLAREAFVSGQYDEYSYNNRFTHLKLLANRNWGVECSGTNAIAASFYDCEATNNYNGGYKLAPSGMLMVHCLAIGNGTRNSDGRGIHSVTNTNNSSTNNGLALIGCRFEGNSAPGGYEIEIESGYGHVITGPQFFSTTGATTLGIGLRDVDDSKLVRNLVVTGGYFGGDRKTASQQLAKVGSNAVNTLFENLGVDANQWESGTRVSDLVTDDSGSLTISDPSRFRYDANGFMALSPITGDVPAPNDPAGANFGVITTPDGKSQLVVRFPSGDTKVIASE